MYAECAPEPGWGAALHDDLAHAEPGSDAMTVAQTHPARIVAVIDGDTIKVSIPLARSHAKDRDFGFHIYVERGWLVLHASIRLLGCNAAEHGTPGGDAATANLVGLLPVGMTVLLSTVAADKYSRWDAGINLPDGTDLVQLLIAENWLAPWNGQGVKPVPPWPRPEAAT